MKTCDEINHYYDQRQDRQLLHDKLDMLFDVLMELDRESPLKDYWRDRWAMLKEDVKEQADERHERHKEEVK